MLIKKPADARFTRLFTPGYIGNLWIKNRVIRAPMDLNLALIDGSVTQRIIDHYKELARGGAGMIIVEYCYIDEDASKASDGQIGISSSKHQAGLQWLANVIKDGGAKATVQIAHAGRSNFPARKPYKSAYRRAWPDIYKYGGAGQQGKGGAIPDEMTIEEIQQCIEDFGSAALRAKEVGFDACELHGSSGYLITNFLSPWNQRPDWYGGHFENRKRFVLQVFENMRKKVGPDYPLGVRLSGTDYDWANPIPIEETICVAQELEALGADYIHVTGGTHEVAHKETPTIYNDMAYQAWASQRIKEAVGIPVICSGSLGDPELAEKILEEGKGDFIGLARPLLADPYWPKKAQEGHVEDIRPCIRCMECVDRGVMIGYITCTVNAAATREAELGTIPQAKQKKKVAIVGGGPGGMEAARVAALKGHDVTLYEKRELGGMLVEAATPDFKSDLKRLINYHITQLEKTGVKVLKEEATVTKIKNGKYDAVIVATGSQPIIPDVPGIKKPIVVTSLDVLHGTETKDNVIVVGGGVVGCEITLFLAKQGKDVTIVEALDMMNLASGMSNTLKGAFFEQLMQIGAQLKCVHVLTEVVDDGIVTLCGLKKEKIEGDTVVLALGFTPDRKLWDDLSKIPGLEVYAIGDCVKVGGNSYDAIHEGFHTVFSLISD
jgi:2,4-dienoyl-CoA reductase-like NADH-dependent reductase (Old Yellow Enzyme family)/thioredoxin reductase